MNLVICAPGNSYSGEFLQYWTKFLGKALNSGINVHFSQKYSPNIYFARNRCLAGDIRGGMSQKPFQNKIEYDYILWLDSDNMPTFENFTQLLSRNLDICAGIYKMLDGRLATVKNWDTSRLSEAGEMEFLTVEDLTGKTDPIPVAYTGMGFMLVKRGVLEKFSYPWFKPLMLDIGKIQDFSTEDIYFCQQAQALGFSVYIDPLVRVEHEKRIRLSASEE